MKYTPEKLQALRGAELRVTRGDWQFHYAKECLYPLHVICPNPDGGYSVIVPPPHVTDMDRRNLEFIALMRNEWLGLLDEIERLQGILNDAIALFVKHRDDFGLCDAQFPEGKPQESQCEFESQFVHLICRYQGHVIGPDQCGKPEHDYCYCCHELRTEIEATQ